VTEEIERYWNPDHDDEVLDQIHDLRQQLNDIVVEVRTEHEAEIAAFRAEFDELNEQLRPIN